MSPISAEINLNMLMPEIILLAAAFLLLLAAPLTRQRAISISLSLLSVLAAFYFALIQWNHPQIGYFEMVVADNYTLFCKVIFLLTCGSAMLISRDYLALRGRERPEYYALMLISTVGMMIMVSSPNLMVIFLGLEIMSLPLYVLAGYVRDSLRSNEAAVKYFFMGAFASAFFLFGIAFVFGGAGTTDVTRIFLSTGIGLYRNEIYLLLGGALVLTGFAFKIAAFPFHMWVPDVYQGAPTPVTAFFSIGPKAAGLATLARIYMVGFSGSMDLYGPVFAFLALFTMTLGNILAIRQSDVKRMLAYSSIAHAGYLMVALAAGGNNGVSSALFYLLAYAFFNMGAFVMITMVEGKNGTNHIDTYRGLASRHPWLAVFLALFMFSLAGFPPTAGFMGKFYLFSAAVESGLTWLVIAAVLNSLVSVFYYLRPLKAAFFDAPEADEAGLSRITLKPLVLIALAIMAVGALGLGIFPSYFLKLAAASTLMII